jgi:hypothetical protein
MRNATIAMIEEEGLLTPLVFADDMVVQQTQGEYERWPSWVIKFHPA